MTAKTKGTAEREKGMFFVSLFHSGEKNIITELNSSIDVNSEKLPKYRC